MEHPNIIKFYDSLQVNDRIYMLLEYAPNGTLFSYVRKMGSLGEEAALKIFTQCCEALSYAHSKRVIHRDLKVAQLLFL